MNALIAGISLIFGAGIGWILGWNACIDAVQNFAAKHALGYFRADNGKFEWGRIQ